jgi:hypothetical protein
MKLEKGTVMILPESIGQLKAPTPFDWNSLAFTRGNHAQGDREFGCVLAYMLVGGAALYGENCWTSLVVASSLIKELTGKYLLPPLDVSMEEWKQKMIVIIWETIWQTINEKPAVFGNKINEMIFRLFIPNCEVDEDSVSFSNRLGKGLTDGLDYFTGQGGFESWQKTSKEYYKGLDDDLKTVIAKLQPNRNIPIAITRIAIGANRERTTIAKMQLPMDLQVI